jgi:hypothetical protein
MEKTNAQHTVIIPSHNTLEHLKNTYASIKKFAPNVPMIIIDDASEDNTDKWLESLVDDKLTVIIDKERKGHTYWYDEGMRRAKTDIVSILHSDMIIGPGYFEPPIHPAGLEKHTQNFGIDYHDFDWKAFEIFCSNTLIVDKDRTTKGIFAPWMLYKEDHFKVGGHDQRFAPYGYEDSDIFNKWILGGLEMIQSRDALCYHMTCRGHRWNEGVGIENADYKETMDRCRREYLRKWGEWIQNNEYQYPIINPKYNKGLIIRNCNPQLIEALEPWFDTLYVDCDYLDYVENEGKRTVTNLFNRIKPYDNEKQNDILISIDAFNFTQQDYTYITQLAAILKDSGATGEFKLGNLQISIIHLKEYTDHLEK